MKPEEVIERLKTIFSFGISNCIADKIARDTTFKALEKQVPKKPETEGDGYGDNGEIIDDTWICPNCEKDYEMDYEKHDYCPNCGQKIDWGNEE